MSVDSTNAKELAQENELLLIQLHQVQEELEHYYLKYQELESKKNIAPSGILPPVFQANNIQIDFRKNINGKNWYYQEQDGRWAGPDVLSTVKVSPLKAGEYEVEFDIIDAISPEIFNEMVVLLNGVKLKLTKKKDKNFKKAYPALYTAKFSTDQLMDTKDWEFQFKFSKTLAPSDMKSSDDHRKLAVRLRGLKIYEIKKQQKWFFQDSKREEQFAQRESEYQFKIDELTQLLTDKSKSMDERSKQIEQLKKSEDEQAKLLGQKQIQVDQFNKKNQELNSRENELQKKLIEKQKEIDDLEKNIQKNTFNKIQSDEQLEEYKRQLNQAKYTYDEQVHIQNLSKLQLEQMSKSRDEQVRLLSEKQSQLEQMNKSRDEQARLLSEKQSQLEQMSKSRDEQARLLSEKQSQLEQMSKSRDEQVRLLSEKQSQLEQMSKSRDEQVRLLSEKQNQLDQVTKMRDEQTKLEVERKIEEDKLRKLNKESRDKIIILEKRQTEMQARQTLLDHEMIKAESQIDLIKDLLLRESGL